MSTTNHTNTTPTRLPIFQHAGWRLVSHAVNRGDDYIPALGYDRWAVDVVEVDGDAWFQQAFEVRYVEGHYELHAGPYYAVLSAHFNHNEAATFDDAFEAAYLAAIEAAITV